MIVDEFAPWRATERILLTSRRAWSIIGEATDGQEAVEKATEMQPDVVLLDIEMPRLNGIKAAEILHQRCPRAKIVFLTQDSNDDLRRVAMELKGAVGYVLKGNAARELVNVITALNHRRA